MGDEVFLPGAEAAQIPDEKLRDYVLDPEHFLGRHKARVFASVLGIRRDDWRYLRDPGSRPRKARRGCSRRMSSFDRAREP